MTEKEKLQVKQVEILCKVLKEEMQTRSITTLSSAMNILVNCDAIPKDKKWRTANTHNESINRWLEGTGKADTTKENWGEVYYNKLKNLFDKNYKLLNL